jgi:hypothetical protein
MISLRLGTARVARALRPGAALVAAVLVLAGAGCGDLSVANGTLLCSSDHLCPAGYHCESDNHCWQDGTSPPDGGPDIAGTGGGDGGGGGPGLIPPETVWMCGGGGASMSADGETLSWSFGGSGGIFVGDGDGSGSDHISFGNLSTSAE